MADDTTGAAGTVDATVADPGAPAAPEPEKDSTGSAGVNGVTDSTRAAGASELTGGTGTSGLRVALVLATSTGGVGQHVRSVAARLCDAGLDVRVHGPQSTEDLFGFTAVGAAFAPVEIAAGPRPGADVEAVMALRRLTSDADVVHAHGLRAGLVAVLAGVGRPTPLVVTWHNVVMDKSGVVRVVYTELERLVARGAQITLGASEDLVARVLRLGGRDVRLGPVGVPLPPASTRPVKEIRAELGVDGDRPLVLTVARLHPQKGLDVLVAAAARWTRREATPQVVLVGSGPLEAQLRAAVAESGAPVRLLGQRDDVTDLISAADVVVLPSRWEARSLVAQEALHGGRPLVATAVGGLPGLLGDGAVLVPPDDVDALDRAVCQLLDEPERAAQLAARGRERAKTWPSEADTAAQLLAVYAELLGVSI